ncbi:Brefeldin A sensitivity protein-related protein [Penicillium paradoxum]|uniref:Brefeldin A sensitivity protein-related protein n=1 Tax=Penicillium paradoxum TaxID=176176 RepID=UPI002549BC20|nr:Brefeldin A sensitivity protein-related protein [Penicillium paradoxum]KAJ5794615.1 Brefeldin A sensitivity protein-related protein [Penicillium paradoxum]
MTEMESSRREFQDVSLLISNAEGPPAPANVTPAPKAGRKLPEWLDHFNARDLKVLFRCSLAAWIAAILIFINPTLNIIGTATFFATLILFMVPPTGIVFFFLLATLTLIIGMGLGWAWGVIAMKAAMAARPAAETEAKLQALGQAAYNQANATGQSLPAVQQVLVYDGWMLDARVTAVYYCLINLFIYLMARVRAANPKFILVQMFATIIVDVTLTIGPLLPTFNGTIPKVLLEPAAIGIGLGLVSHFIFFPRSTSHVVVAEMEGLVQLLRGTLDATENSLLKGQDLTLPELHKIKVKCIAAYRDMVPSIGFLPLDFSVGWWGADDVKSLKKPLRQALVSSLSLLEVQIARIGGKEKLEKLEQLILNRNSDSDVDEKAHPREVGMRQLMDSANLVQALRSPEHESMRAETIEVLRESSKAILPACQEAAAIIEESLHAVNQRWIGRLSQESLNGLHERSQSALQNLQALRASFATETTERLIETHADIFDEKGVLKSLDGDALSRVQGITVGMVFEEQVLGVADSWERVLGQLVALLGERQKIHLWLPKGLRYAVNWVGRKKALGPVTAANISTVDPDVAEKQSKAAQQHLNISRGYRANRRSGFGRAIIGTYHWFINAEGLYAMRMVAVTIALSIPAAIPATAGFYYREKGLWALIMGQTTLVIYMADFTFSLLSRAAGTIVGGLLGLVAWYIGSGRGPGNPYGLAAIMAVVIILLMWGRLFASPAMLQATIMAGATCILVVGYSFEDTHIPTYGNPGWGYSVFWRRLVLVLIGSAAALIVQLFPRPPSASRHICKSLSNVIRSLSDHYALLLSCWGQGREEGLAAEKLALNLAETLMDLDGPIALLRFEFSSSPFDSDRLGQVQALCQELNQNLARLLYLSASLPEHLQARMARKVGLLNHHNIGDVMAVLAVVEQSLKTGDPLPEVLPTPLLNRCHEFWQLHQVDIILSKDLIRDENYRRFCVAISAYLKFLATVDDLVLVMKGTLGESHIVSRDLVHEQYGVKPLPTYQVALWSFITSFCGLSVVQAIFHYSDYFTARNVPGIVASYGASAVLVFGAIESPLAQPRALVFGHFFSALIGICITKLFSLMPDETRFESLRWLAASLSTAIAIVVMQLTGTTHPPAGATALLPATSEEIWQLSWYFLPVILLSSTMLLACALLFNNLQRRYPVFWIAPNPPKPAVPPPAAVDVPGEDKPKNPV